MKATKTQSVPEGYRFYNVSEFTFAKLKNDATNIADNLTDYIKGFSENARTILESFDIYSQIARLDRANLLYLVVCKFVDDIDLHPDRVKNNEMGYIFEELVRKFSESYNEEAGAHLTARDIIYTMTDLLEKKSINTIDAKSEVILTIMASLVQQESQLLSQNVKLGLQYRYQQGKVQVNHNRFLGYTKD